jgi:hypothetical protein
MRDKRPLSFPFVTPHSIPLNSHAFVSFRTWAAKIAACQGVQRGVSGDLPPILWPIEAGPIGWN